VTKTAIILAPLALSLALAGCGSNSVSEARVAKLEQRISKLEASNKDIEASNKDLSLKLEVVSLALRDRLKKLDNRTWGNDQALYTGLAEAQYDITCGPNPQGGCHVPLGLPGAVFQQTNVRRRIFATPLGPP
jgi:hypothetical protein